MSFNDFTQSIDNANVDNSAEFDHEPSSKNTKHIQQIQTNNKNFNNFLEALQKIKPANSIISSVKSPQMKQAAANNNAAGSQVQVLDHQSPAKANMRKGRKGNLSEIPAGQLPQARHEKYQKMMMKVKQSDQKEAKGVHHSRIKSTNEGVINNKVFGDKQLINRSTDRQRSNDGQNVSMGIPSEVEQNPNQRLKITFVGDQALLKKHNQQSMPGGQPIISVCSNPVSGQPST